MASSGNQIFPIQDGQTRRKFTEDDPCGVCFGISNNRIVCCDECDRWHHYKCVGVNHSIRNHPWTCPTCTNFSLVAAGARSTAAMYLPNNNPATNHQRIEPTSTQLMTNSELCPTCHQPDQLDGDIIICDKCKRFFHRHCVSDAADVDDQSPWECISCVKSSLASRKGVTSRDQVNHQNSEIGTIPPFIQQLLQQLNVATPSKPIRSQRSATIVVSQQGNRAKILIRVFY